MLHKLFIFAKPYCSGYSPIKVHKQLFALAVQQNSFFILKFSTTCCEMAQKTALFIVAEGSEELELVAPVDILRRANVAVTIADVADSEYVKTKSNLLIKTDAKLGDVKNKIFDAVVIPGGPSYKTLASADVVGQILLAHEKSDKVISAICAAPFVLFKHGIAKGKSLTSYPTVKSEIEGSYQYKEESTVVDGNLVTSRGPATAVEFGLTLVEVLLGNEEKDKVAKGILYPL
ncbi:protein dj-1beta-like isoform X1 [Rhopalosiphum padi]|uniref:protein dj-1beta-like isoform X1 n=2 Tax=Rhopalosiphum padi TaxID=40932 RepID=UPI00298DAC5C|nr:protein dj-1beta-like isoform X1 [Rhopalosiphum padi]